MISKYWNQNDIGSLPDYFPAQQKVVRHETSLVRDPCNKLKAVLEMYQRRLEASNLVARQVAISVM